jgi:CRISP-associated protein Cas1
MRAARETQQDEEKQALVQTTRILARQIRKLPGAGDLDQVRGLEGDGARRYFKMLSLVIKPIGRDHFSFDTRNRRPPRDRFNALLSFLYALVLNDCRSALESVGLDPQMGFLHALRPGRPALALDLQEEFRAPMADRLALTLVNREQIKERDFSEFSNGAVLLNDDGRKSVIAAYQARKQETLTHPLLDQSIPVGLLPHVQARLLARHLRGDIEEYLPFLQR